MRRPLAALAAALALLAAGCGGDEEAADTAPAATTQEEAARPATTQPRPAAPAGGGTVPEVTGRPGSKPRIARAQGRPPSELDEEDLVEGRGRAARAGDTITVQYVGQSWSTGREFDASWDRGEPFSFALGGGEVIPGWDEGIQGMKEGGRRVLVIPPDLAYGPQGSPPAIGPDETLVFVVDLEEIEPG